jgi:uncharacterized protein (TIGR00288 family)
MSVPYTRAPHMGGPGMAGAESPHAALLIDFDNVTMGMRSDLSKELKTLLDSDVIKGKVSVQRAYADWRRYPQYIVPLSEASVDLIFAPAYGSNKKNATDIRMAIDGLELVFIRPEIGTYILLTGDSDFSSLVLKLKEYGKYVIGVGIQESSSDILVQNCDEYYSYTSLTGLTKTTELDRTGRDPWQLVKDAVAKMTRRGDVMRSDRLKQVMQELDSTFDEGAIGFSKFSKFLAEASSRGLIGLKKMENGQYEIMESKGRGSRRDEGRSRSRRGRSGRRDRSDRSVTARESDAGETRSTEEDANGGDPLSDAYDALRSALSALRDAGREPVRDSDVKRKMLEADSSFDETELGFAKFSRFLTQAEEHGVVTLARTEGGNLDVTLAPDDSTREIAAEPSMVEEDVSEAFSDVADVPASEPPAVSEPVAEEEAPKRGWFGLRFGSRRTSTSRGTGEAPGLFEGQGVKATVGARTTSSEPAPQAEERPSEPQATSKDAPVEGEPAVDASGDTVQAEPDGAGQAEDASTSSVEVPVSDLALPSEAGAIARYLTHRYKGVGEKTAETLVEALGADLFRTMHEDPDAISRIVPKNRAEQVLEAWRADYERRAAAHSGRSGGDGSASGRTRSRGRGRS